MAVELITKEDLQTFKQDVLTEIRLILKSKGANLQQKEWLKSFEVRKMLGISPGTLQQLRINGTLEYSQMGGLMFYRYEDIMKVMEANKHKNPFTARNSK
jgi:hypothetical protein